MPILYSDLGAVVKGSALEAKGQGIDPAQC